MLAGHHVVVSTSTASGKSLCYALPVLEALAADRSACAIFMFPTKALAQVRTTEHDIISHAPPHKLAATLPRDGCISDRYLAC